MIRCNLLILILSFIVFATGCGETGANSIANSVNAANKNTAVNLNAANTPPSANANLLNTNSGMTTTPNMPANAAVKNDMSDKVKPQLPANPASDNSEVTTALGENLVQTRTFKNHPQINKIESVTTFADGNQKKTVKVYLKNGQVKDLPESKVKDAMTETAANILKAIG